MKAVVKEAKKEFASAFVSQVKEMPEALSGILRAGDILISMGAGSISALPHTLVEMKHV
jgi:UDP-N-acetylmuramate--alanine ligase